MWCSFFQWEMIHFYDNWQFSMKNYEHIKFIRTKRSNFFNHLSRFLKNCENNFHPWKTISIPVTVIKIFLLYLLFKGGYTHNIWKGKKKVKFVIFVRGNYENDRIRISSSWKYTLSNIISIFLSKNIANPRSTWIVYEVL